MISLEKHELAVNLAFFVLVLLIYIVQLLQARHAGCFVINPICKTCFYVPKIFEIFAYGSWLVTINCSHMFEAL